MTKQTMQAILVREYGGPEQLRLERVPRPVPAEGEIVIRIHATGVLPADCATRQGTFFKKELPYIPGTAFAGIVAEVGAGVTTYRVGEELCGRVPEGASAEYALLPATPPVLDANLPRQLLSKAITPRAHKPTTLSFDEAATLSGGATTAWTALLDGGVQTGQRVLIHSAAGGVGLFAVQFAKWRGAHVTATTSTGNLDFVRSLGADEVIDYTTTSFDEVAGTVDMVLDTLGGEVQQRSMRLVKRGGVLVSLYQPPSEELAQRLGIHAIMNQVIPNSSHLEQIVRLIEEGYIRPVIQKTFALSEAALAHTLCETGHGRGRIVLHIAD